MNKYSRKKHTAVTNDSLESLEDNIVDNINSLRDDFYSLKDIMVKKTAER